MAKKRKKGSKKGEELQRGHHNENGENETKEPVRLTALGRHMLRLKKQKK